MNDSDVLTPAQLAKRWGVTPRTLRNWRASGKGPKWFHPGGSGNIIRYRIEDVIAHENEQAEAPKGV